MAKSEGSNVFAIVQDELNPIGRPREEVVPYDLPPKTTETDLFKQLHQLDPSELAFRHHFRAARYTLSELGACASDLVWRRAFMQVSASSSPSHEGEDDRSGPSERDSSDIQATIHDIVKNWVFSMPNLDLSSRGCNVTPKFVKLVQILKSCEPYGELFRGIVFGLVQLVMQYRMKLSHFVQYKDKQPLSPLGICFALLQTILVFFALVL